MPGIMAAAVFLLMFASSATAGIYTWTDASGVVHFTDTPPPEIRGQVQSMLVSDRKRDSTRSKSKTKAAAKQEKTCTSYRRKLAQVQSQLRSGYGNSKGNNLRHKRRKLSQSLSRECILR